jgi:hypothetical protein
MGVVDLRQAKGLSMAEKSPPAMVEVAATSIAGSLVILEVQDWLTQHQFEEIADLARKAFEKIKRGEVGHFIVSFPCRIIVIPGEPRYHPLTDQWAPGDGKPAR